MFLKKKRVVNIVEWHDVILVVSDQFESINLTHK